MQGKHILMELRASHNLAMRYIENNFLHGELDRLTVGNGWIIGYIYSNRDKDVFQKDIEEHFSITRSTVSKVVDCMVNKGLIERKNVSSDARLRKLVLTDKAVAMVEHMRRYEAQIEEQLLKGFSENEREQLVSYIQRIKDNITDKS